MPNEQLVYSPINYAQKLNKADGEKEFNELAVQSIASLLEVDRLI